jgi:hypothetical protein
VRLRVKLCTFHSKFDNFVPPFSPINRTPMSISLLFIHFVICPDVPQSRVSICFQTGCHILQNGKISRGSEIPNFCKTVYIHYARVGIVKKMLSNTENWFFQYFSVRIHLKYCSCIPPLSYELMFCLRSRYIILCLPCCLAVGCLWPVSVTELTSLTLLQHSEL